MRPDIRTVPADKEAGERPAPHLRVPTPAGPAAFLTGLQWTLGNASVARALAVMRQTPVVEAGDAKTASKDVDLSLDPPLRFTTAKAKVGDLTVHLTGRVSTVNARGFVVGEKPPKLDTAKFVHSKMRELLAAELAAVVPTGASNKIEASLGGQALVLELAAGAEKAPQFNVAAQFSPASMSFATAEVTRAPKDSSIRLDLTVHIEPAPRAPADPAAPAPAPPTGDASVTTFSLGGEAAVFAAEKRSGVVMPQATLDELDRRLPSFVKAHPYFAVPEQRIAFLQEMRAYFGSDANTIAHFAELKDITADGVKGSTTYMHAEAGKRLKAVQDELGKENMPASGGVGWPRRECSIGGAQGLGNLHNIGFAIDYNAYETPHLKDRRQLDLLSILTGRSAQMDLGKDHVKRINELGGVTMGGGTEEEKKAYLEKPEVKALLDKVLSEARDLSAASESLRFKSLEETNAAGEKIDRRAELLALREQWFAAAGEKDKTKRAERRAAVMAQLPTVLGPWLKKVDDHLAAVRAKITAAGFDPAAMPEGKERDAAARLAKAARPNLAKARAALGGKTVTDSHRRTARLRIKEARDLLGTFAGDEAETPDEGLAAELERLQKLVTDFESVLGTQKWAERVEADRAGLLSDPNLVFGKERKAVGEPGMAQLVDTGFFTLKDHSTMKGAFTPEFMRSMVKHGFNPLATSDNPDSMHFELRWTGPGMKK